MIFQEPKHFLPAGSPESKLKKGQVLLPFLREAYVLHRAHTLASAETNSVATRTIKSEERGIQKDVWARSLVQGVRLYQNFGSDVLLHLQTHAQVKSSALVARKRRDGVERLQSLMCAYLLTFVAVQAHGVSLA